MILDRQEPEKEFNLLDEPWIVVRTKANIRMTWSLLDTFAHAHEAVALAGELPTQDIAVMRLLLAIMHGAFVNDNIEDCDDAVGLWQELWEMKQFPYDMIKDYLESYRERFWLFHPTQPFYQSAHIKEKMDDYKKQKGKKVSETIKWKTVARLVGDLFQSDNAPRLFPVRTGKNVTFLGYAEAARWLLHLNGFDDDSAKMPTPQGVGYLGQLGLIYAEGKNLFETLMLNFVLADQRNEIFSDNREIQSAYWEKTACETVERQITQPRAQKDLLTLQSRRILLHREEGRVTGYLLTMGDYFAKDASLLNETMTAWKHDDKKGIVPKKHRLECQIWRDFSSLLGKTEEKKSRQPGVIHWLRLLQQEHQNLGRLQVAVVGASYDLKGAGWQIVDYIYDHLAVNAALLSATNDVWIQEIVSNLNLTQQAVSALGKLASRIDEAAGDTGKGSEQKRERIAQFAREDGYHHLDKEFRKWLIEIDPEVDNLSEKIEGWLIISKKTLKLLGKDMLNQCPESAIIRRPKIDNTKQKKAIMNAIQAFQFFKFRIHNILG